MKLWQLISVCREDLELIENILQKPDWADYHELYANLDYLTEEQEREKLDQVLPDELVIDVLKQSKKILYISGGYLRVRPFGSKNQEITWLDVFCQYGGNYLEDALEYGLIKL